MCLLYIGDYFYTNENYENAIIEYNIMIDTMQCNNITYIYQYNDIKQRCINLHNKIGIIYYHMYNNLIDAYSYFDYVIINDGEMTSQLRKFFSEYAVMKNNNINEQNEFYEKYIINKKNIDTKSMLVDVTTITTSTDINLNLNVIETQYENELTNDLLLTPSTSNDSSSYSDMSVIVKSDIGLTTNHKMIIKMNNRRWVTRN